MSLKYAPASEPLHTVVREYPLEAEVTEGSATSAESACPASRLSGLCFSACQMQGASYFSNSCRVKAERVSHFTNRCRVEGVKAPERESACPASRFSRLCFSACESVLLYKGVTSLIDQSYFTNNELL